MSNAKTLRTLLTAVTVIASLGGLAATASAQDTQWQKTHPRREEVNNRLANQHNRVKQDMANGTMTKAQAHTVHRQDRKIRQEERDMASQNGSHVTKQEQRALNQQENRVSKEIHTEGGN